MISRKKLGIFTVVAVLVIAVIAVTVFALIKHKNDQIPDQIPATKPDKNETGETTGIATETNSETETQEIGFDSLEKSDGLEYTLSYDGDSYIVIGIGSCKDREIVIPETYRDKPVTAIGDRAFAGADIDTMSFSNCITSIGARAFAECNGLDVFFYGSKKEWVNISKADGWNEQSTMKIWPTEKQEDNWEVPVG